MFGSGVSSEGLFSFGNVPVRSVGKSRTQINAGDWIINFSLFVRWKPIKRVSVTCILAASQKERKQPIKWLIFDDEINLLNYWSVNSGQFPLLFKLAIEIYSCLATTAGIERGFSVAGHLIGTRAATMKDENFEKKLFCNVNQEVMMSGRKWKFVQVSGNKYVSFGHSRIFNQFIRDSFGEIVWC